MNLNYDHTEKILTDFIKNETHRIGIKKAVIGLSGGIDSALSAYLTVKALGNKNVNFLLMPYKTSSKSSITDALQISEILKTNSRIIDISDAVDSISDSLDEKELPNVRKGNIMARVRMIMLYDESAKNNALVIGTSNKSEILLGYSTIFGDSASAINPIGDLYKTQIRGLAKHLNIPENIISKKPSADLWKSQTDEDELGFTYDEVDKYLYEKVDERRSEAYLIKAGYSEKFMSRVNSMIIRSQFKRLTPLIAKVSNRTVNIDFRYNRDWNT